MAYSVQQICAIIRACHEGGVTRLQIGDLKLSFTGKEKPEKLCPPTPEEIKLAQEYENDVFQENEKRIRTEELSQLRLSDPEAYEELVTRGELEDDGKESSGTDA